MGLDVGVLVWNSGTNSARFEYEPDFLSRGIEISPIHLKTSPRVYNFPRLPFSCFKGLPGAFADSLPDRFGESLMNTYFSNRNYSLTDLTPLDRLAYIGYRGIGALEYFPAKELGEKRSRISMNELEDLAAFGISQAGKLVAHLEPNRAKGFEDILSIATPAGGARAKAVISWSEKTGEIRSGQLDHGPDFKQWLIKLDVGANTNHVGDSSGFGRIEYAYYQMAIECGIKMQRCKLMEENARGHFMTERFDRQNGGKQHVHTLCGLRHFDYEDVNGHTYGHLFETARFLRVPADGIEQLYRQMVFNVAAVNCDDHTKNFSFLMDNDKVWRAAPGYDICYSYAANNPWVNCNMGVNNKTTNITRNDLLVEAEENSINGAEDIIDQIIEVVSRWKNFGKRNGVGKEFLSLIETQTSTRLKILRKIKS